MWQTGPWHGALVSTPSVDLALGLEPWQWLVALFVTFVSAVLQGTIGFGYAMLAVPALSLIDPRLAPVPQILSALPITLIAAVREREHLQLKAVPWLLAGRVPGALLGAAFLGVVSRAALDLVLGAIVLSAVIVLATPVKLKRSPAVDLLASIFSGFCGHLSAIGGPPIALLFRDSAGPALRSTLGVVFAFGIVVTLVVRTAVGQITWNDVWLGLLFIPVVVLGMQVSHRLHPTVDRGRVLQLCVLGVSAVAALGLLGRALLG